MIAAWHRARSIDGDCSKGVRPPAGRRSSAAPARSAARDRSPVYDVAVVGAGLAGLTAARRVHEAGRSVVVLEARDRVGGRNLDHRLGSGNVVELGGQWTGPGQREVMALARELKVATFPTYGHGESVYYRGGTVQRYRGDIPPTAAAALGDLASAIESLNAMARSVPAAAPWTAPQAPSWDRQTIGQWMTEHMQTQEGRDLSALSVRAVYGEEPSEISLLDLLASISGVGGDYNTLIGSAQSIRFVGGPQQLSQRLATRLGSRVHLSRVVHAVHQRAQVTIVHSHGDVVARRAVLTLPKPLLGRLSYDPPLAPAHDQILQRQPMGSVVKVNAIYRTPFWRARGLNGQAVSDTGPIRVTYDNSPPDGRPGVLVGFMEGDDSRHFYGASLLSRRRAALRSLGALLRARGAASGPLRRSCVGQRAVHARGVRQFQPARRAHLPAGCGGDGDRASAFRRRRHVTAMAGLHGRRHPLRRTGGSGGPGSPLEAGAPRERRRGTRRPAQARSCPSGPIAASPRQGRRPERGRGPRGT